MKVSVMDLGGGIRLELHAETDSEKHVLSQLMRDLGGSLYAIDTNASFRVESVGGEDLGARPNEIDSIALEHRPA